MNSALIHVLYPRQRRTYARKGTLIAHSRTFVPRPDPGAYEFAIRSIVLSIQEAYAVRAFTLRYCVDLLHSAAPLRIALLSRS